MSAAVDEAKCAELASRFVQGPARSLLKPSATQGGLQDLAVIIRQAIRVGLLMWKQPADIKIRGYEELKGEMFSIDELEVRAHPSQLNPARLPRRDDAVMDMVIQPSFVVLQGENAEKVWSQAMVLWS